MNIFNFGVNLASYLGARQHYQTAIALLKANLTLLPGNTRARDGLISIYSARAGQNAAAGQFGNAISDLERCLRLDDNNVHVLLKKTQVEVDSGDAQSAEESLKSAVEAARSNDAAKASVVGVLFGRASKYAANGHYAEALTALKNCLELEPRNIQVLLTKGQIEAAAQDSGESIRTFRKVLTINPLEKNAITSLAGLYRGNGDLAALREVLTASLDADPGNEVTLRELGDLVWSERQRDRASLITDDSEDGVPSISDLIAHDEQGESEAAGDTAGTKRYEALKASAERWAMQRAAQRTALGRMDAFMTFARYAQSLGRLRVVAIDQHRRKTETAILRDSARYGDFDEAVQNEFTSGGTIPHSEEYYESTLSEGFSSVLRDFDIKSFVHFNRTIFEDDKQEKIDAFLTGHDVSDHNQIVTTYRRTGGATGNLVRNPPYFGPIPLAEMEGKSVAVIGEDEPFLESIAAASGADVTSVRHFDVANSSSLVKSARLDTWLDDAGAYDLVVCNTLVQAWGMGRYGETIDPHGDKALLRRLNDKLSNGGRMLISVPIGFDHIVFNTTRVYGPVLLPRLLEGVELDGSAIPGMKTKSDFLDSHSQPTPRAEQTALVIRGA